MVMRPLNMSCHCKDIYFSSSVIFLLLCSFSTSFLVIQIEKGTTSIFAMILEYFSIKAIKLIVHRPEANEQNREEYYNMAATLLPVIRELIRKTNPLLEHEVSAEFAKSQLYGTKFCADQSASLDFRSFV